MDSILNIILTLAISLLLLVISIEDNNSMNINDKHLIIGFSISLVLMPILRSLNLLGDNYPNSKSQFLGCITGFTLMLLIALIGQLLLGIPALGHGDLKLTLLGGSWLGVRGVLLAISIAFISSGLIQTMNLILGRFRPKQAIPFAQYLSLGIFSVWILGTDLIINTWFALWQV